jgi:hypothetical protein
MIFEIVNFSFLTGLFKQDLYKIFKNGVNSWFPNLKKNFMMRMKILTVRQLLKQLNKSKMLKNL